MESELRGYKRLGATKEARKARLKELWGKYHSQEGIATALGVSQPIVSQWFARHGLRIEVRRVLVDESYR
jgi:predicted transcriptional regulator